MSKEMRELIDTFNQYIIKENNREILRLRDVISIPQELNDIFEICKNEIELSNGDLSIIALYSKIFFDCLMQFKGLTSGRVDMISTARANLVKSEDEKEVKLQYKQITNPTHIFSAELLKMLNDYKQINFIDEKLKKYRIIDIILHLIEESLTNTSQYSNNFRKVLLASKISVD